MGEDLVSCLKFLRLSPFAELLQGCMPVNAQSLSVSDAL